MQNRHARTIALAALSLASLAAYGQETRLPLDELLSTPISTAAKYDQQMSEVAASVTIVTDEEIERYGWTTLDEVIQAVRGFYLNYDRAYSSFGMRGIGLPSDANSRMLVLLDGHTMNGGIWSEGASSGALALDLGMVEKIEIVRGPASALYGSHAMLGVINIITKRADSLDGLAVSALTGSRGRRSLSLRSGRELSNGFRITASANWSETEGDDRFYPEFAEPGVSDGVARDLDYEDLFGGTLSLEKGGFRIALSMRERDKGIPNASYDTAFNEHSSEHDQREMAVVTYERAVGRGKQLALRGYWDRNRVTGYWPYDTLGVSKSINVRQGGEARFRWDIRPNQRLTAGAELAHHPRIEYRYDIGDYHINIVRPFTEASFYLQHEYHPTPRVGIVTGVRHDRFSHTSASTNPRLALIFTANRATTLKLLYGTAFLSPSLYQLEFEDPETPWKINPSLEPETIRTLELVFERRLSPELLVTGALYDLETESLIESQLDPRDSVYWYQNRGSTRSRGGEIGVDWRRKNGLWAHLSYATQATAGEVDPLINSPRQIVKGGISTTPWHKTHAGLDAVYEAGRYTRAGDRTSGFLLVNGTVSRELGPRFRAAVSVRNLLDTDYAYPLAAEWRPQVEQQDGRTFAFKLSYTR